MKFKALVSAIALLLLAACGEVVTVEVPTGNCTISSVGGNTSVAVSLSSDWTASCEDDWVILTKTSGSAGKVNFNIGAKQNPSSKQRSSVVYFKSGKNYLYRIVVNQKRHPAQFDLEKTDFNVEPDESSLELKITADADAQWWITDSPAALSFSPSSGKGTATVSVDFGKNKTEGSREFFFKVSTDAYVGSEYGLGHNVFNVHITQECGVMVYEWVFDESDFPHNAQDKVDEGTVRAGFPPVSWYHSRLSYGHPAGFGSKCGVQLTRSADIVPVTFSTEDIKGTVLSFELEGFQGTSAGIVPTLTVGEWTKTLPEMTSNENTVTKVDNIDASGKITLNFSRGKSTFVVTRIKIVYVE